MNQARPLLLGCMASWALSTAAIATPLDDVFTPNAAVCIQFDATGRPIGALIDGRSDRPALNAEMLKLLQSHHWDPPPPQWIGKWVAYSVAPTGGPVPEVLPTCPAANGANDRR